MKNTMTLSFLPGITVAPNGPALIRMASLVYSTAARVWADRKKRPQAGRESEKKPVACPKVEAEPILILVEQCVAAGFDRRTVLAYAASLYNYSKSPLASAFLAAAKAEGVALLAANALGESFDEGQTGTVMGKLVHIHKRRYFIKKRMPGCDFFPPTGADLECTVVVDGCCAASFRWRFPTPVPALPSG